MKTPIRVLMVAIMTFTLPLLSFSTNIPVTTSSNSAAYGCSDNIYYLRIFGSGPHTISIQAIIDFNDPLIHYGCDSISPKPFVLIVFDSSNVSVSGIIGDSVNGIWTGTLASSVNDTTYLQYHLFIDCSAISSNPFSISLAQVFTEPGGSNNYVINSGTDTLVTSPVLTPHFVEFISPVYTDYLDTSFVYFIYSNSSGGAAHIKFTFSSVADSFCQLLQTGLLEFAEDSTSSFQPLTPSTLTSAIIPANNHLVIRQQMSDSLCYNRCNITANMEWQCDIIPTDSGVFCTTCRQTNTQSIYTVFKNDFDTILIQRNSPPNGVLTKDLSCMNDTAGMVQWEYQITSTGIGSADSVLIDLVNGYGSVGVDDVHYLTLLPDTSLVVDAHCKTCTVQITTLPHTTALCGTFVMNPIVSAAIKLKSFRQGDTLNIKFKTFRCNGEENDSLLLNSGKIFNHWQFMVQGKDVCYAAISNNTNYNQSLGAALSSNIGQGSSDIDQELFFHPSITDLNVPHDSIFGDHATYEITTLHFVEERYDYQILGGINPGGVGVGPRDTINGYLRAKIHCDSGLRIEHPANDVKLKWYDPDNGILYYLPLSWYCTTVPDTVCQGGDYFFYYNLSDTNSYHFLENGKFEFTLQACCNGVPLCCGSTPAASKYKVEFHLLSNPSNCLTLLFSDSTHINEPVCDTLSIGCDWLPLSSEGDAIQVHCPGCLAPGVIVDYYLLNRTSLGFLDSDNDGIADSTMQLISDTSAWYMNNKDNLNPDFSSFGNTLKDVLRAHFQEGDKASGGYEYYQLTDQNVFLSVLQLSRSISAGMDTLKLNPVDFDFYIDEPDIDTINCLNCAGFHMDSKYYRTILTFHASAADLVNYLQIDTAANLYLYNFDATMDTAGNLTGNLSDSIVIMPDPIHPFTGYLPGQIYRLAVNYNECGNFLVTPAHNPPQLEDYRIKSSIQNTMYLSGTDHSVTSTAIQMLNTDSLLNAAGWSLDSTYNDSIFGPLILITDSFASAYVFYCETFSGRFYFFSEGYSAAEIAFHSKNCDNELQVEASCTLAGGFGKIIYPYEYHPPLLWPVSYQINIPPHYNVDSLKVQTDFLYNGAWVQSIGSLVTCPVGGLLTLADSIFPVPDCLDESKNYVTGGGHFAGNTAGLRRLHFYLRPDSCFLPDNPLTYGDIVVTFGEGKYACYSSTLCSPSDNLTAIPDIIYNLASFHPHLGDYPNPFIVYESTNQLSTTISILDTLITGGSDAPYAFLIPPDSIAYPYLGNWRFVTGATTLFPDTNGVIHLNTPTFTGVMLPGYPIIGDLIADYKFCADTDTVIYYLGWNCFGYPLAPFDPLSVCGAIKDSFIVIPNLTGLTSEGKGNDTIFYENCTELICSASFISQEQGHFYPDTVTTGVLPPGLFIDSMMISQCNSSVLRKLTADTINYNGWGITPDDLLAIGLADSSIFGDTTHLYDCLETSAYISVGCIYDGADMPFIRLTGLSYCNNRISESALFEGTIIKEGSQCTDCFIVTKTVNPDTVVVGDTVTFEIVICANNSAAQTVSITELLPDTVSANFVLIDTIPTSMNLPAFGCDTFEVRGYFLTPGSSFDTLHINKVEVTTANNVVFSDSVGVWVVEPCIYDASIIIGDGDSVSVTGVYSYTGSTIYVMGTWNVDTTLTLSNCTVYVQMGGQIYVFPGDSLILDTSSVTGCGFMWRGINIEDSGNLIMEKSELADGSPGIFVDENANSFRLHNSYLYDCAVELYVEPNSSGGYNPTFGEIYGSKFGLQYGFKTNYPMQAGHGTTERTCIDLNDMAYIQIGDNTETENYFADANRGITDHGSFQVVVTNCEFERIFADPFYYAPHSGYAIAAIHNPDLVPSHMEVNPVQNGNPTIHGCQRGIYSNRSTLDVLTVVIMDVVVGILSEQTVPDLHVFVNNSTISASRVGIRWRYNPGADSMVAVGNSIAINGYTTANGISVDDDADGTTNYSIRDNYINTIQARNAIRLNGPSYVEVINNYIKLENQGTSMLNRGVTVNNCYQTIVNCNTIYGDNENDTLMLGLNVNVSPNSYIQCNYMDSTGWGAFFGGVSNNVDYKGNTMQNHFEGLRLNSTAVIDVQIDRGNLWTGSYGNFGAVSMNWTPFPNLILSLFQVDGSNPSLYPSFPTTLPDNTGWFDPLGNGGFECSDDNKCLVFDDDGDGSDGGGDDGGSGESLIFFIANDSTLTSEFIDQSKSIAQEFLYDEILNDSTLLDTNTVLQNFVSLIDTTSTRLISEVKYLLKSVQKLDQNLIEEKLVLDSLSKLYLDSLENLDLSVHSNPTSQNFENRKNFILQLSQYKNNTLINFYDQWKILRDSIYFISGQKNDSVLDNTAPNIFSKTVNKILFKLQLEGPDSIQPFYDTLLVLSNYCPYENGPAVYVARGLITLMNDSIDFDENSACPNNGYYRVPFGAVEDHSISVKPNPTSNKVTIKTNYGNDGFCNIRILDSFGKLVQSRSLGCKESEVTMDLNNLSPGIYALSALLSSGFISSEKIVIIR